MIATIRVLDDTTANKIAAGEVVERPSSVVKELVENSIDAQSQNIEIEITDGGISFIRITDDGIGMNIADAQLAVLRHATSKIRQVEDLYSINSLGFRGEALPSIASVSKFSLTTRTRTEALGTFVDIHGGTVNEVREAGCGTGTTITVSDLFYNTPARRKFLKTVPSESGYVHDVVGKMAIAYPAISFKLINNKRLVLATPGNGNLADTLASLYGQKIAPDLLPIDYSDNDISVAGFIGKPHLLKSNRHWQTFIVNGRIVNSRMLAKALDNAYHSLLPKNGYPLASIVLSIPSNTIDVNVHPQKSEVKFSDEKLIFRMMYRAITAALQTVNSVQQIAATLVQLPKFENKKSFGNYETGEGTVSNPLRNQEAFFWKEESLPLAIAREVIDSESRGALIDIERDRVSSQVFIEEEESQFVLQPLGQIGDCFIVAHGNDGLYIVDQHAAHERILYDYFSKNTDRIPVQQLLVPLMVDLDEQEINLILGCQDIFTQLGFFLEQVGPTTMRITEAPADIPTGEFEHVLRDILSATQDMQKPSAAEIRHAFLQVASCRGAIKAGESLHMRQMQALLKELCSTTLPYTCPHGRPVIVRFTSQELAKMFKRT